MFKYVLTDEVEGDDSYFGRVQKGTIAQGDAGKITVVGRLKRSGKVYTVIIPNEKTGSFLPIIKQKIQHESVMHIEI